MFNWLWPARRRGESTITVRIGRVLHWTAVAIAAPLFAVAVWAWGDWTVNVAQQFAASRVEAKAAGGSGEPRGLSPEEELELLLLKAKALKLARLRLGRELEAKAATTIEMENGTVLEVDDKFLSLPPAEQQTLFKEMIRQAGAQEPVQAQPGVDKFEAELARRNLSTEPSVAALQNSGAPPDLERLGDGLALAFAAFLIAITGRGLRYIFAGE